MELNNIPEAFQTKLRLMIISALMSGKKTFRELKSITNATDGNISVQITKLEELRYITVTKEFVGKKAQTTCEITATGQNSFMAYVEMLNCILENAEKNNGLN